MRKPLTVTIEREFDKSEEKRREWYDWTPDENRIGPRLATVTPSFGKMTLSEEDRCDPSKMRLYVYFERRSRRHIDEDGEMDVMVTAAELDELIRSLTLLRDAAIAEWMLEPGSDI